jgi:predicted RND superfamily exporter protein
VLVGLLFAFVYRIGFLALLMLVPVGAGICWGLAAYTLLRGQFTLLAATVPTLLIGIGIDHCIHLIQSCRYSMTEVGLSRTDAVLLAWKRLLPPITLASLTTAITFATLTTASLRGLADLGWSGALVTMGVYAACISLLPAILLLSPARWLTGKAVFDTPIRTLAQVIERRAGALAALVLLTAVVSLFGVAQLEAMDDNRLLESGDLPSLRLQDRIAEEHGLSSSPVLLRFANPDDAIELVAEIERPAIIGNLLTVDGIDGLIQVHPIENTFMRSNFRAMTAALDDWINAVGLGDYELSGAPVMNERINELVYRDVRIVLPLAVVAILAVLALGTRSLVRPLLVLLPLTLALAWLVGLMGWAGISASVVTVAIMPLVLGIGVDGGVHLLAAWQRHEGRIVAVFAETGLAIVITVATSITAFAAFLVAQSPSLLYFGSQASFALLGCLVVTMVVLPFLFRLLLPRRGEARKNAA